jgi:peptide deformylase
MAGPEERVKIFQIGSDVIRAVAKPVGTPLDAADRALIETMAIAMRQAGLVGIAAPQVGVSKRIFLTEIPGANSRGLAEDALRVFINPEILEFSAESVVDYEGCGSVADANLFGEVERSQAVTVRYLDETGQEKTGTFEGFLARIIQHEFDHLEGVVFTDKLHSTQTLMSGSEYRRMRAEQLAARLVEGSKA